MRIRADAAGWTASQPDDRIVLQVAACPPTGSFRIGLWREHETRRPCTTCQAMEARTRDGKLVCASCGVGRDTPPLVRVRSRSPLQVRGEPRGSASQDRTPRAPIAACILHGPGPVNPRFLDRAVRVAAELAAVNALNRLVINRVHDRHAGSARAVVEAATLSEAGPAGITRLVAALSTRPGRPGCGLFETLRASVEPQGWSARRPVPPSWPSWPRNATRSRPTRCWPTPRDGGRASWPFVPSSGCPCTWSPSSTGCSPAEGGGDIATALEHLVLLGRQARYPEALLRIWDRAEAPPHHDAALVLRVAERAAASSPRSHSGGPEVRNLATAEHSAGG